MSSKTDWIAAAVLSLVPSIAHVYVLELVLHFVRVSPRSGVVTVGMTRFFTTGCVSSTCHS